MADHTITAGQRGAYEIPVAGGTTITIDIAAGPTIVQVIHHGGDAPIYVSVNTPVVLGDPSARMVTQDAWMDVALDVARSNTIHVSSRSDATVSVALR